MARLLIAHGADVDKAMAQEGRTRRRKLARARAARGCGRPAHRRGARSTAPTAARFTDRAGRRQVYLESVGGETRIFRFGLASSGSMDRYHSGSSFRERTALAAVPCSAAARSHSLRSQSASDGGSSAAAKSSASGAKGADSGSPSASVAGTILSEPSFRRRRRLLDFLGFLGDGEDGGLFGLFQGLKRLRR